MDAKAAGRAINTILWRDWDPIGCGVPEDEYESYVWPIYQLLIDGVSRTQLEAHLWELAVETLAVPNADEARLKISVDKLLALGLKR